MLCKGTKVIYKSYQICFIHPNTFEARQTHNVEIASSCRTHQKMKSYYQILDAFLHFLFSKELCLTIQLPTVGRSSMTYTRTAVQVDGTVKFRRITHSSLSKQSVYI